jgi:hypothetical protein
MGREAVQRPIGQQGRPLTMQLSKQPIHFNGPAPIEA